MNLQRARAGLWAGSLGLLLCACVQTQSPVQVARDFMAAIERFDLQAAERLVCPAQQARVRASLAPFEEYGRPGETFYASLEGLTIEEQRNDGHTALVHVRGELSLFFLGQQETQQINEMHTLVRQDGRWLVCDP